MTTLAPMLLLRKSGNPFVPRFPTFSTTYATSVVLETLSFVVQRPALQCNSSKAGQPADRQAFPRGWVECNSPVRDHATRESGVHAIQSSAMRFANQLTEAPHSFRIDRLHRFTKASTLKSEGGFCRMFVTGRHTRRPRRSVGNRCGRNCPRSAASNIFLGR